LPNVVDSEDVIIYGPGSTEARVEEIESMLELGPVSIAVDASNPVFQYYSSGIIGCGPSSTPTSGDSGCGTSVDHAVLLVGYGVDDTCGDYWIVKNSWGPEWGLEGYVHIAKGKDFPGECGIRTQPNVPDDGLCHGEAGDLCTETLQYPGFCADATGCYDDGSNITSNAAFLASTSSLNFGVATGQPTGQPSRASLSRNPCAILSMICLLVATLLR